MIALLHKQPVGEDLGFCPASKMSEQDLKDYLFAVVDRMHRIGKTGMRGGCVLSR